MFSFEDDHIASTVKSPELFSFSAFDSPLLELIRTPEIIRFT